MSETEMRVSPERAAVLVSQLQCVRERITAAAKGKPVRLVAVSKLKPANDVLALHTDPSTRQLHFGENYAQELTQKAALLPRSIRWHFIGGLQSGHCKNLGKIPNLWCVSSVDTLKKAQLLDKARGELIASHSSSGSSPSAADLGQQTTADGGDSPATVPVPLNIHVQVNTSGEDSKSGAAPGAETVELCRAIARDCPNLRLLGLMTIGAIARSRAAAAGEENDDFVLLRAQRDLVARELGSDLRDDAGEGEEALELSMGMSDDFEGAIALGSREVRIGSTIFGERPARADAKLVL